MENERLRICLKKRVLTACVENVYLMCQPEHNEVPDEMTATIQFNDRGTITMSQQQKQPELFESLNSSFHAFVVSIERMQLNHIHMDKIFALSHRLVASCFDLFQAVLASPLSTEELLQAAISHMNVKFNQCASRYQRDKKRADDKFYVEPQEKAIGLKWKSVIDSKNETPHHVLQQDTFMYIPVIDQLRAFFTDGSFYKTYCDYNDKQLTYNDHVYRNYSSGSNFKNSEFFQQYKNAIQLQLAFDECQFSSPLKTHTINHKLMCVYMQIKNLPPKYLSKLDSIQVAAICKNVSLKQLYASIDNIVELLVVDLKQLESEGIKLPSNEYIKGSLINVVYDNLGGNALYCLPECFRWDNFCRHCECNKEECERNTREDSSKMRTKDDYEKCMEIIRTSGENHDSSETKGFKGYCLFNNLKHFHVLDNNSRDLMHDVNEGVLPYLLETLFKYITQHNILSKRQLIGMVRDYNYGRIKKQEKPSSLSFDRSHMGQSASQLYFLFIHIPFILWAHREQLMEIWATIESMLQIMQILYSKEIPEHDVNRLENLIDFHMRKVKELFGVKFIPKYHFLLHYPNVIRKMGPPSTMWMMRYESKHRTLTDIAKKSNNSINLPKTLAYRHQETTPSPSQIFSDHILKPSKTNPFNIQKYAERIDSADTFWTSEQLESILCLTYNGYEYRDGLLIVVDNQLFEIIQVLFNGYDYFLLLELYTIGSYSQYSHSFIVAKQESANLCVKKIDDSTNVKPHKKTLCSNRIHVIASSMDVNFNF